MAGKPTYEDLVQWQGARSKWMRFIDGIDEGEVREVDIPPEDFASARNGLLYAAKRHDQEVATRVYGGKLYVLGLKPEHVRKNANA